MIGPDPAPGVAVVRGTGICSQCGRHTNDGLVALVEQPTGPGLRVVRCWDRLLCARRRARARGGPLCVRGGA